MRFKLAALPLILLAASANAEEYHSITTVGYSSLDYDIELLGAELDREGNQWLAETTYYFSGKETLGPLKEFAYINKVSNVSAAFFHNEIEDNNADSYAVAGEYFAQNGLTLGISLTEVNERNIDAVSLGYLFTPNFLLELSHTEFESDEKTYAELRYNHPLSGADYLGFDFVSDNDFDTAVFSSKYFTSLGGGRYLTAELSYADYEGGNDYWQIGSDYFFTQSTSLGIKLDERDDIKLAFSHFFSRNIALEAAYSTMAADDNINIRSFGSDTYRAGSTSTLDMMPDLESDSVMSYLAPLMELEVEKFELGITVQL
ncbi:putative porin [Microbulbifer sp. ZKSA006]|uniref:putative porin n=1 Tax=Microbulbifer sp. ZKSA006 TaxID=3243390 RepID=UPI0040398A4F